MERAWETGTSSAAANDVRGSAHAMQNKTAAPNWTRADSDRFG